MHTQHTKKRGGKRRVYLSSGKTKKTKKTAKRTNDIIIGGGNDKDVCKTNINDLLLGDFKVGSTGSLSGNPKAFADDIKKEATGIGNVASGNWLAGPGPPPAFPKCVIM